MKFANNTLPSYVLFIYYVIYDGWHSVEGLAMLTDITVVWGGANPAGLYVGVACR